MDEEFENKKENTKEDNNRIQERLKETIHTNVVNKIDNYIDVYRTKNPNYTRDNVLLRIANYCGVALSSAQKWGQQSGRIPELPNLVALSTMFGCSIDEFLKGFVLTENDKEELKNLGFSEETAIELIKNYSEEKMQERIDKSISEKMGLQEQASNKISASDNQPEIPTLFEHSSVFPKIKYSNLLNTLINENSINKLVMNLDNYKKEIDNYINKNYPGLNMEEKIAKIKEDIGLNSKFIKKQGKLKEQSRDIETTESIYKNLTKKLPDNVTTKFEEESGKIFHKLLIDMLFPLQ